MPCVCEFASLNVRDAHDYSDDYEKLREYGMLAINFELTNRLAELTRGGDYRYCSTERVGDTLDPCGVTLIPPETLPKLAEALASLDGAGIPDYDRDLDDSPYPLDEQLARLSAMINEAISGGEWVVCFGA